MGLPCSLVMSTARSSWFSIMRSYQRRMMLHRSLPVFERHAGQAASAASMARRVSSALREGTVPMISPVAGLLTSMDLPSAASTHSPSM
jgi:hypothetical protein